MNNGVCPRSHRDKSNSRVRSLGGLDRLDDNVAVGAGNPDIGVLPDAKPLEVCWIKFNNTSRSPVVGLFLATLDRNTLLDGAARDQVDGNVLCHGIPFF